MIFSIFDIFAVTNAYINCEHIFLVRHRKRLENWHGFLFPMFGPQPTGNSFVIIPAQWPQMGLALWQESMGTVSSFRLNCQYWDRSWTLPIQSSAKSNPMPCPCLSTDLAHVCCTHFKHKKNAIFFSFKNYNKKKV